MQFNSSLAVIARQVLWSGALLLFVVVGVATGQQKKAFTISGYIGEETGQAPKKPISAAELRLDPIKAKKESNADGEYVYKEVPGDTYILTAKADGYRPISRIIDLKKDSAENFYLWPVNPSKDLFFSVGARTVAQVKEKKISYEAVWAGLRADAFPPTDKYWLVRGIQEHDSQAKQKFKPFSEYLITNVESIENANEKFKSSLEKKTKFPDTAFLSDYKIGDHVATDIMVFQLRNSPASMDHKKAFFEASNERWKGMGLDKEMKLWIPK